MRLYLTCYLYIKTIYSTHLTWLFLFSRTAISSIYDFAPRVLAIPACDKPRHDHRHDSGKVSSTSAASVFSCVRQQVRYVFKRSLLNYMLLG